jgi:hypothetical protein
MRIDTIIVWAKKEYVKVDWQLLLFLLLFMNVKLIVKLVALCFIYFKRFNLSFRFSAHSSGLPLFYPLAIGITLVNYIVFSLYKESNYTWLMLTGIAFWVICILALHQVRLSVNESKTDKIHNAILLFFVINAIASFTQLFAIIFEIEELNPYRYQGMYQKYYIGTGDYIKGITFDTSTTNAVLSAFGVVYFLSRKQMLMTSLCMIVLLLTVSNFTNLLILACFVYLFLFRTDRDQKSVIIFHIMLLAIFMINVSPQNNKYAIRIVEQFFNKKNSIKNVVLPLPVEQRPDSILNADEKKYKMAKLYLDSLGKERWLSTLNSVRPADTVLISRPVIPKANIHAPEYQHRQDTSDNRLQVIKLSQQLRIDTLATVKELNPQKDNGKLLAIKQTMQFFEKHPHKIITGTGIGNFSSKLAFRASGLKIAGGYPQKYTYINKDFEKNHLSVYLGYFSKDTHLHSVANTPNSVYIQLLSEYGIAGIAAFVVFYIMYFAKRASKLTYGFPVLLLLLGAFCVDYWYEQLSIVILFELLLLLNRKETADATD